MSYPYLERCDGPACTRCGCQDVRILKQPDQSGSWWGGGKARCRHCGTMFGFREVPKPIEVPAEVETVGEMMEQDIMTPVQVERKTIAVATCPDCGAVMKCSSTRKNVRYHKCPGCGKTTKTAK